MDIQNIKSAIPTEIVVSAKNYANKKYVEHVIMNELQKVKDACNLNIVEDDDATSIIEIISARIVIQ
jgi:hypothetical protein